MENNNNNNYIRQHYINDIDKLSDDSLITKNSRTAK